MSSLREVMRGNLLVFTVGDVLRQLSMFITYPYFSLYVQALGGSVVDIGLVNSLRPVAAFFLYPIAGYLSDKYSRVKIITITGLVGGSIWVFFIFAKDWRWLAVGNLFLGLMTFYFPAANSLMAESLPGDKRALAYSLWQAVPLAVGIFSPLIGGYLITLWGVEPAMKLLYALTLAVSILIAAMNYRFLHEKPRDSPDDGLSLTETLVNSYREVFSVVRELSGNLKAYGLMLVLGFFFNSMVSSYWVVYFVEEMGLSEVQWGLVLLVASAVNVLLLVSTGVLTDRFGPKKVLTMALAMASFPIILFPYVDSFYKVTLLFLIIAVSNSFLMSGAPSYMAKATPEEKRGRIMSVLGQGMLYVNTRGGGGGGPGMGAVLALPTIVGSIIGGVLYSFNPQYLWLSFGASMMISAIISRVFLK
jgi:MFS family permease